ncbi:hypothetical protein HK101_011594 [Irineochytrium annulatum]|nr:hypothetical protein HK101_011594 [Irineochytrium annulatum]
MAPGMALAGSGGARPLRFISFEYLDKIREELHQLDSRLDLIGREKAEYHTSYVKYYEQAYRYSSELHRQQDINGRYQAIINQLLPMLSPAVQEGVRHDMDSIKQLAAATLPPIPAAPAVQIQPDPGVGLNRAQSVPAVYNNGEQIIERKGRGRPSKASLQQVKGPKRIKGDDDEPYSEGPAMYPGPYATGRPSSPIPPQSVPVNPAALPPSSSVYRQTQRYPPPAQMGRNPQAVPKTSKFLTSLEHGEVVCALALTNPFSYVFTGGKGGVKIWDVNNVKDNKPAPLVGTLDCLDNYIRAAKMTPDGKSLIVAGEVHYMVVCDIGSPNPSVIGKMDTPKVLTYALATSNDSRYCFSCCSDGTVNMWDLASRRLIRTLGSHEQSVTCCAMTADGARIVTGSLDKTVRIWDIIGGKEVEKYDFGDQIFSLGYCPIAPPTIAVGLDSSCVDVRNLVEPANSREIRGVHSDCVLSLKYSPSGSWFATTGKDKKWVTGSGDNVANVYSILY